MGGGGALRLLVSRRCLTRARTHADAPPQGSAPLGPAPPGRRRLAGCPAVLAKSRALARASVVSDFFLDVSSSAGRCKLTRCKLWKCHESSRASHAPHLRPAAWWRRRRSARAPGPGFHHTRRTHCPAAQARLTYQHTVRQARQGPGPRFPPHALRARPASPAHRTYHGPYQPVVRQARRAGARGPPLPRAGSGGS